MKRGFPLQKKIKTFKQTQTMPCYSRHHIHISPDGGEGDKYSFDIALAAGKAKTPCVTTSIEIT